MDRTITRRDVLAAVGAVGIAGLAGCSSSTGESYPNTPLEQRISISDEHLELYGEPLTNSMEQAGGLLTVEYSSLLFADLAAQQRFDELTLGSADMDPVSVYGTLGIDATSWGGDSILQSVGEGEILNQIESVFRDELERFGVEQITRISSNSGTRTFGGIVKTPDIDFEVIEGKYVTVSGFEVPISAGFELFTPSYTDLPYAGVLWVRPDELSTEMDTVSISGSLGTGLDVTPEFRLPELHTYSVSEFKDIFINQLD
ncbi:hypothetical protein NDI76_19255 [Halogeometricum sp. S1BR25-6]|uniref:Uncharacterized protein n=1 Tax=Halogeometricum salsisoli TaxID=2950536 RepID=A0ABU2GJ87_9EURY|nr:hypothetical protein [Halogeometricum sp. S1BR25-6]MDS0300892.1 hypothetical protein [Halogeometricum sp. S1BR25-6]